MSVDPLGGYDDPSDPGFKQWLRDRQGGGGGPGSPPPGPASPGPGGGYGGFFGSPSTVGAPSYTYANPQKRRDLFSGIDGFRSWMDPSGQASTPTTDTVPAMLTPGEFVVNRNSAQMPGIAEMLHAINSAGVQHMAGGGFVPWGGYRKSPWEGPPAPKPAPTPAPVPGGGGSTGGGGSVETPINTLGGGGMDWTGGGGRTPGNTDIGKWLSQLLGQYSGAGTFSPEGSQAVRDAVSRSALGAADAARARANTMGTLYGADPATVAAYKLQTDLGSQGSAANAVNDVVSQQALKQDEYGKSQLNQLLAFLYNYWQSQQDFEHGSGRPGGL